MSKKANEQLWDAATKGDLKTVKKALEQGAKINKASQWDGAALHIASSKGFLEIIEFLLENGADSTQEEMAEFTPLHLAARDGQIEAAKLLLEKGGPYTDRVLSDVSSMVNMSGRHPSIADLIRKKQIQQIKPETDTCNKKDAKLVNAIYEGNLDAIKKALKSGADINAVEDRGLSVLRWAVRRNYLVIVGFLLENGAEINAVSNYGWTALMEACMGGHTPIVELLIEKGADVNIKTVINGTAIYFAANDGYIDIVKLLLKNGADPNVEVEIEDIYDNYTQTAIEVAYLNGHQKIVKILQKYQEKKN
ncbi:MAG: ankyrin repeat domain-containing protein [Candidatus Heimdallarchaeota archaeon]